MAVILVIDDERAARALIRRMLRRAGHKIYVARNGLIGLQILRREPIEVVITDLLMPEMEGIETIRAIRAEFPQVRIIAMSGGGTDTKRGGLYLEFAGKLGADARLANPFRAAELNALVERILQAGIAGR